MNIFLVDPDYAKSAYILFKASPIRARKQLVECCQMLASVDYKWFGKTCMMKKDGTPYACAYPHHPCVTYATKSREQYVLLYYTTFELAHILIGRHACSDSFFNWDNTRPNIGTALRSMCGSGYMLVRKGSEPVVVSTLTVYVTLMRDYLKHHKKITL